MGRPVWKGIIVGGLQVVNELNVAGYGRSGPEKSWTMPSLHQKCTVSGFQDLSPARFSTFWTICIGSGLRFYSSFRIRIFKCHFL